MKGIFIIHMKIMISPKIIHSDYEKAIHTAIRNFKNFDKNIIHI